MKKQIKYLFSCLLVLRSCFCFGQSTEIDSLLAVVKTAEDDTTKVNILNKLFLRFEFTDEVKAKEYLNEALELAQKANYKKGLANTYLYFGFLAEDKAAYPEALKNYFASLKTYEEINDQKGIADSYMTIAGVYKEQSNYPEALENYFISLKIYEKIGNKKGIASSYNNIGNVYSDQGNYAKALKYYFASLKIKEALDDKKGMGNSFNSIGNVYYFQNNYPEALKNHTAALKIRETIADKHGIATSYLNIGNVYYGQAMLELSPQLRNSKLDHALNNFFASLKIMEAIGNKKGMANSYNNIGNVYNNQGDHSEALKNYVSSLKISEAIGNKAGVISSYNNIGIVFTEQKKFNESEEYLIKAKLLSKEIGNKELLKDAYYALTQLDSAKGNYKGAYENHKLYILYNDSLDNEETRKKTIQSQMTFDFDKKEAVADAEHKKELENQEVLANEKERKQKVVLLFVAGGLLLVLAFAGFVFRSLRMTRKQKSIIEQQKDLVEKQKLEVEQQKLLVEEHQKDIIDSITYARRIQHAQLPTETYISRTLKRLYKNGQ